MPLSAIDLSGLSPAEGVVRMPLQHLGSGD